MSTKAELGGVIVDAPARQVLAARGQALDALAAAMEREGELAEAFTRMDATALLSEVNAAITARERALARLGEWTR